MSSYGINSGVGRRAILLSLLGLALAATTISCSRPSNASSKTARIGLVYIGPHELINQIIAGFKDGVAQSIGKRPYEIIERHANGDKSQVSSTVNGAFAARLDVIATITTPVSQVALKNAPATVPVVFVGVTDPVGAGLVKSLEQPGLSTGVSDLAPLSAMLALIKEVTPRVKRIGFPFSPEEEPAVYSRQTVERLAPGLGLAIDARPVTSNDELTTVVRALARSNDAILVGADNGMFEAAPTIAKIALDNHKPFFAADSSSLKAGAAAGVTIDYSQVGLEGGKLAVRVLNGERAGAIPVALMTKGVLELNRSTVKKLGLRLDDSIWKRAKTIYE